MANKETKSSKAFFKVILTEFDFLINRYGFKLHKAEEDSFGLYVYYKKNVVGISVSLVPRDGGVFVDIYRLINMEFKDNPINITKNSKINKFDFESVLAMRDHVLNIDRPNLDDLVFNKRHIKVFQNVVRQFAAALKKHGKDILNEDLSILSKVEQQIKSL